MSSRKASVNCGATNARAGRGASLRTGASLKWQRLKPYKKFAEMIDRHWDGIAAYCRLENKVSLGFVEGSTTKSG
jgi:transposase